ncbi:glycosyltransferase family 4 protein [Sphingomonas sp. SRS2]|uniref:glycosyltransferase family 4 protein n=1 Tax=Sphingomonas sp. SRS2 TaxID=133190 RepID=UPI000618492E|nr:glycosyltransferase family 4 protein [Sphingomonas sp. SRS2]KKC25696.1 glycosyltransferase [Sphingomonas sp. SRS2]
MKILYIHQYFSTPSGASGLRSYDMAQRALKHGHRVTMVCGNSSISQTGIEEPFRGGHRRGMVNGIDVIEFDLAYANAHGLFRRAWTFLRFAVACVMVALREDYDVIFTTTTPLTAGIPGIVARWLRRKPFVFEVRDLWPELPKAMGVIRNPIVLTLMSALEWISYRSADRLIGLSPGIVDGIARRGVHRDRIIEVSNGCDVALFGTTVAPWRPEGVRDGDLMAVFTGAHGMANGLDAVLDVAAELQRRGRDDIRIVLIGEGKLKPGLQKRARRDGISNVIFHDPVGKRRLVDLLGAADLGLQILANVPAFYYGTSPNKFFDYLAAGRPVLINYPGWLAEYITVQKCGFVVPPDDAAAFADALERAADDRATLTAMGSRAQQLAIEQFDRGDLADRWVDWVKRAATVRAAD